MERYINNRIDPLYEDLTRLIPYGEDNAISMNSLGRFLGIDAREVRQWIENARLDGLIIASSSKGYYIPTDENELKEYCKRTEARATTTLRTLAPVKMKLEADI